MRFLYRVGLTVASASLLLLSLLVVRWGESWASIGLVQIIQFLLPLVAIAAIISLIITLFSTRRSAVGQSLRSCPTRAQCLLLDASSLVLCLAAWIIMLHEVNAAWFGSEGRKGPTTRAHNVGE